MTFASVPVKYKVVRYKNRQKAMNENVNCTLIKGQILHFVSYNSFQVFDDGFIIFNAVNGKILDFGNTTDLENARMRLPGIKQTITLTPTQILIPGFIDTHIHAPQYPNAGLGYDRPLLDWLQQYTYPLEKKYRNVEYSQKVYDAIVRKSLDYGTTTASYFGTLFKDSTMILAKAALKHGQRALVGKVNMITLAPSDYIESSEQSINDTLDFVDKIKELNSILIKPTITPRFALSVDMQHMKALANIAHEQNLNIQTHISENLAEIEAVQKAYPDEKNYAAVYQKAGLLGSKTILAHGIYLKPEELDILAQTNTSISHCPDSNTNLKSGLCDVRRLLKAKVNVALGTDVSGGATPSMLVAMRAAIQVSQHLRFLHGELTSYVPLNFEDVFYLATLSGAKALALDDVVGNFQIGRHFDAIVADLAASNSPIDYLMDKCTPRELLQKLIFTGDDRNIVRVYVNGKLVKNIE